MIDGVNTPLSTISYQVPESLQREVPRWMLVCLLAWSTCNLSIHWLVRIRSSEWPFGRGIQLMQRLWLSGRPMRDWYAYVLRSLSSDLVELFGALLVLLLLAAMLGWIRRLLTFAMATIVIVMLLSGLAGCMETTMEVMYGAPITLRGSSAAVGTFSEAWHLYLPVAVLLLQCRNNDVGLRTWTNAILMLACVGLIGGNLLDPQATSYTDVSEGVIQFVCVIFNRAFSLILAVTFLLKWRRWALAMLWLITAVQVVRDVGYVFRVQPTDAFFWALALLWVIRSIPVVYAWQRLADSVDLWSSRRDRHAANTISAQISA